MDTTKLLEDRFCEWIMETQHPMWKDKFIDCMHDGDLQLQFLQDNDLPDDTEIFA